MRLERGVTFWEGLGFKIFLPGFSLCWAEGLLLAGRMAEARKTGEKALALATETPVTEHEADDPQLASALSGARAQWGDFFEKNYTHALELLSSIPS